MINLWGQVLDVGVVALAFLIGHEVGAGHPVPWVAWSFLGLGLYAFVTGAAQPKEGRRK